MIKNPAVYKLVFIILWLAGTLGNVMLIFALGTMVMGITPKKAVENIINNSVALDTQAIIILSALGAIILISLIIVWVMYDQFTENLYSKYSKKLFIAGIVSSFIFFLLVFTKLCSAAGLCV